MAELKSKILHDSELRLTNWVSVFTNTSGVVAEFEIRELLGIRVARPLSRKKIGAVADCKSLGFSKIQSCI